MKSRNFRLAPAVAVATVGLLFAGTAGAAVAAPSEESPSPSATSTSAGEEAKADWKPGAWYDDEEACKKAGEKGRTDGKWREYRCKHEEKNHGQYDYKWHLYYRR
ncbi:hypothetical protein [Streptomyces sp. NPDC053048]|uniref:hypothetical protein n=1 Tax=Streptomyces sp. NPDC053048 TaxID=3365694 RepID=UPI0037CDFB8F